MGIEAKFSMGSIRAEMERKTALFQRAIINRLTRLGRECVNHARTHGSYTDQTGNLRSSIGFVITANGVIVEEDFRKSGSGSLQVQSSSIKTHRVRSYKLRGGGDGTQQAKAYARQLGEKFPTGYALIVVAGMDYAYYVEAKGKEVLSGAESYANREFHSIISILKSKMK